MIVTPTMVDAIVDALAPDAATTGCGEQVYATAELIRESVEANGPECAQVFAGPRWPQVYAIFAAQQRAAVAA